MSLRASLNLVFIFFVILAAGNAAAVNGPFGAPTYSDYLRLTPGARAEYEARLDELHSPDFVQTHVKGKSFVTTDEGAAEFRKLAVILINKMPDYSRLVSIGRSGTGLLSYIGGFTRGGGKTVLTDLPFSFGNRWHVITDDERTGLRAHLTRNNLTPQLIASAKKPILFYDLVYTGVGAQTLLVEIMTWAQELKLKTAVKENLHFLGFYAAEIQSGEALRGIYYATLKELGGSFVGAMPTAAEISEQAKSLSSSSKSDMAKLVGKAEEPHVSASLYNYLGTHGPNAHESLTIDHWADDLSRLPDNEMRGQAADNGHLELYYLFKEGELDHAGGCRRLTQRPAVAAALSKLIK